MIIALILTLIENLLFLNPIGLKPEFLILFVVNLAIVVGIEFSMVWYVDSEWFVKMARIQGIAACVMVVLIALGSLFYSPMFNSGEYHRCIEVVEHTEEELEGNIPDLDSIDKISLMDTASASKLGDRTLGTLTELVSQYCVGNYYTICINGEVKKVAPLEYNGFFKWANNKTIPGYVMVDPLTNEAEYIPLEKEIVYAPSAYFGEDLMRHFWMKDSSTYYGEPSFQISDDGNPYWVVATLNPKTGWFNKVPDGCAVMDAHTGIIEWYSLEKIPEWVDLVFTGNNISELYNRYGTYVNGFWNLSQTGVTQVTQDFGYITMEDDVYVYTGITSVSSDESNLGFILVNTRTGEFDYYVIPGAEEYSAMGAAQGIVQNFGYEASFPSLVMVEGTPTYVMVLKDANGLVKQYAMVNYKNYTIAVVADTLKDCTSSYLKALAGDVGTTMEALDGNAIITKVEFVTIDGQTYCFVVGTDGVVYKAEFAPEHMLYEIGQEISLETFTKVY